ncbi:MAG: hypothetical protein ACTSUE_16440 [Promethearchaeota archaeon]
MIQNERKGGNPYIRGKKESNNDVKKFEFSKAVKVKKKEKSPI